MSTKLSLSGSVIWDKEIDDLTAAKVIALVTQTSDVSPMGVGVIPPHNE